MISIEKFKTLVSQLNSDLNTLLPLQNEIYSRLHLDIMFIMDCTGSMGSWIIAAKKELSNIIDYITSEHNQINIRMSFVGYRDISDKEANFSIMDFSSNISDIQKFISIQQAMGGADTPEDVAGALKMALKQNWLKNATKYAVFISDAPPHGTDYHDLGNKNDYYPNGDPNGNKIEKLIEEFAKKDITLFGIEITNITKKMYEIFTTVYEKFCGKKMMVGKLGNSTKSFGFFISTTLNHTLSQTSVQNDICQVKEIIKNLKIEGESILQKISKLPENQNEKEIKNSEIIKELNFEYDSKFPNFKSLNELSAICHSYFIVKDKNVEINWAKPLLQKSQISTKVKINLKPFSSGAMRYAFYMTDINLKQNLVCKLPKIIDKNYNLDIMKKDIESLFICNHIVNEFNDRVVSLLPDPNMLMNFVHSFIYEIITPNHPYKYYWVENIIEGDYEKFNNNSGWVVKDLKQTSLIAQALSHFSWQLTKGYLLIVDLQGGTGVLTDPQIHCLNEKKFGKGNLGYPGIVKFFFSHKCNYYCQKLGLVDPIKNNTLPKDFKFYDIVLTEPLKSETINKLCDLCRQSYRINSLEYFEKRKKFPESYCDYCEIEKKNSMKKGKCTDCKEIFWSSEFWFLMKRTDFPTKCSNCRRINREKMRSEIEKEELQENNEEEEIFKKFEKQKISFNQNKSIETEINEEKIKKDKEIINNIDFVENKIKYQEVKNKETEEKFTINKEIIINKEKVKTGNNWDDYDIVKVTEFTKLTPKKQKINPMLNKNTEKKDSPINKKPKSENTFRNNKTYKKSVPLKEKNIFEPPINKNKQFGPFFGLTFEEFNNKISIKKIEKNVDKKEWLKIGDIILDIGNRSLVSSQEIIQAIEFPEINCPFIMKIQRNSIIMNFEYFKY